MKLEARKVYLYKDSTIEKEYDCIHIAAKDLNICRQTVRNYCDNKRKNKKYDLRWK